MRHGYERFFGLAERPFSLTPDPSYLFESRGHSRAMSILSCALSRRERFILLTGEIGVGKTTLCRRLVPELRADRPVGVIANPLLTPSGLFGLLLEDFGVAPGSEVRDEPGQSPNTLRDQLVGFLNERRSTGAVVIVDEAHSVPVSVVEQLLLLGALERQRE